MLIIFYNILARAGAHGLAQGGFSVMRGGDFWQGAAAGFVSSLAGSGAQRIGIHGWGMVGVSAFSGGAGAAIAGGKTEDILFGVVCGAMVGMLNHEAGEKRKERETIKFFNRLRNHYEGKSGNEICLTRKELDYLISSGKIKWETSKYNESTKTFSAIIDFYNSDTDLKLSFGKATVYYMDNNGKVIYSGFHDVYDFDPKPLGTRSIPNEIITRTYNVYSSGKAFEINY